MWRPGASPVPLTRSGRFDAVLEPGELAAAEDRGPTAAWRDGPTGSRRSSSATTRSSWREATPSASSGSSRARPTCWSSSARAPRWPARWSGAWAHLAGPRGRAGRRAVVGDREAPARCPEGVVHLRADVPDEPLLRRLRLAVSAAGYNAFHELIRFGVPSAVRADAARDRRPGRAGPPRGGDRHRAGGERPRGLVGSSALLDELLDAERRAGDARAARRAAPANGAAEAARWLEGSWRGAWAGSGAGAGAGAGRRAGSAAGGRGAFAAAFAWLARVPRTLLRLRRADDLDAGAPHAGAWRSASRTRSSRAASSAALAGTPDPPESGAGGHELAPDRAAAAAGRGVRARARPRARLRRELAGGDYDAFLRRRLALILASDRALGARSPSATSPTSSCRGDRAGAPRRLPISSALGGRATCLRADRRSTLRDAGFATFLDATLRGMESRTGTTATPTSPDTQHAGGPACATRGRAESARCPNLVVIGAQKCGTSGLHYYLSLHPEISMSKPEGAQLLHRGAQLDPRRGLVPRPLRRPRDGAGRVVAQLHGLPAARRGARSACTR